MAGGSLSVEVSLTDEDVVNFNLWRTAVRRDKGIRQYFSFLAVVYVMAVLAVGYLLDLIGLRTQTTAGFVIFFLVLFFIVIPARRLVQRWYVRNLLSQGRNAVLYAPTVVTLGEDAIHSVNEYADTRLRWPAIERVEITPDYLYIFPGSATALILPRRSFASEAQFEEFCEKAAAWHAASDTPSTAA